MRNIKIKIIALLISSFISFSGKIINTVSARDQVLRTGIISRIEFAPAVLDSIRHELNAATGSFSTSLSFIPLEEYNKSCHDSGFDFLLVEKGLATDDLKNSYSSSGNSLLMSWVLAARNKALELTGGDLKNLRQFTEILKTLKTESPHKFPWFEPLGTRAAMINFCRILGEAPTETIEKNKSEQPAWQEKSAIGFLYRCIEEEVLNPMSVEADIALANSVFIADDTYFSTTWLPLRQLINQQANKKTNNGYIVFPDFHGKKKIPTITLDLWYRKGLAVTIASLTPEFYDSFSDKLLEMDYETDQKWFNEKYQNQYDALIMGNF